MKFGDNLKNVRKSKNMSQEDLAEKLGVSRQSVSKWENGDAYPEMSNIIALCQIFKCNINDLVTDNLIDINSLDEDIKMSVVKLKEEHQKKMKGLSQTINVIAKIGEIGCKIASIAVIVAIVAITFLGIVTTVDNENINIFGNKLKYVIEDDKVTLTFMGKTEVLDEKDEVEAVKYLVKYKDKKGVLIFKVDLTLALVTVTVALLSIALGHLSKLFTNIHDGKTPFTLENVEHIKKIAYYMIAVAVVSMVGEAFAGLFVSDSISLDVDGIDIINILFLFSMAYIFEYGYEIQADSKGVMYNEE